MSRRAVPLAAQDYVVSRTQALAHGLTPGAIAHRKKYAGWQEVVTGVYVTHAGEPTRRQLLIAALLYAGAEAAIDGVDACRFFGLKAAAPDPEVVHVVVPRDSPVRSRGFVRVRRTTAPFRVVQTERLRYVDPADAVVAAARERTQARSVLALLSDAVQRRVTTYDELVRAHVQGSPRGARLADDALAHLRAGTQSAPEADFRMLAQASLVLPPLLYNRRIRLPDGRILQPDALCPNAPLIHETNGRSAHARDDLFDDMQLRHEVVTTVGFTVLHTPPRRLTTRGRDVIGSFERCYLRLVGQAWPPGVLLLPPT